jgi:hypothetical protein
MDWAQIITGGLVGGAGVSAFVTAILTGRLLPKKWVDDLRAEDRLTIKRQQEEITEWRTAWIAESMIKRELVTHVMDLMETGKITEKLLREITKDP